jgi:hypothetical protein
MVNHYRTTLDSDKNHNPFAAEAYRQSIIICLELKKELKREKFLAQDVKRWPYPVDFFRLSERVLDMQGEIAGIIKDEKRRAQSIVYKRLLQHLGGDLKTLASSTVPPGNVMSISRPG